MTTNFSSASVGVLIAWERKVPRVLVAHVSVLDYPHPLKLAFSAESVVPSVTEKARGRGKRVRLNCVALTLSKSWGTKSNLQLFCLSLTYSFPSSKKSLIGCDDCLYKLQGAPGEHFTSFVFSLTDLRYPQSPGSHGIREPTVCFLFSSFFLFFSCCCWLLALLGLKCCQQKLCSGCTGNLPNVLRTDTIPAVASGLTSCSYFFQACFLLPAEFPKGSNALMDPHSEKMSNSSIQKAFVRYCIQPSGALRGTGGQAWLNISRLKYWERLTPGFHMPEPPRFPLRYLKPNEKRPYQTMWGFSDICPLPLHPFVRGHLVTSRGEKTRL